MKTFYKQWTALAAVISAVGALIHLGAIAGGQAWYAYFGAPPAIVASAAAGTWLAPVSTLVIALLMAGCGAYACSAIGWLPRLPLLRAALAAIALVCLLRALVLVPLAVYDPQLRTAFEILAAIVWGSAGIGFALAFVAVSQAAAVAPPARRAALRG